jgi:hypothetical protein
MLDRVFGSNSQQLVMVLIRKDGVVFCSAYTVALAVAVGAQRTCSAEDVALSAQITYRKQQMWVIDQACARLRQLEGLSVVPMCRCADVSLQQQMRTWRRDQDRTCIIWALAACSAAFDSSARTRTRPRHCSAATLDFFFYCCTVHISDDSLVFMRKDDSYKPRRARKVCASASPLYPWSTARRHHRTASEESCGTLAPL